MPIDRDDVGMDDAAFDMHAKIVRKFNKAVMDTAFDKAAADGCKTITPDRLKDAATVVAESAPTYLEVDWYD